MWNTTKCKLMKLTITIVTFIRMKGMERIIKIDTIKMKIGKNMNNKKAALISVSNFLYSGFLNSLPDFSISPDSSGSFHFLGII